MRVFQGPNDLNMICDWLSDRIVNLTEVRKLSARVLLNSNGVREEPEKEKNEEVEKERRLGKASKLSYRFDSSRWDDSGWQAELLRSTVTHANDEAQSAVRVASGRDVTYPSDTRLLPSSYMDSRCFKDSRVNLCDEVSIDVRIVCKPEIIETIELDVCILRGNVDLSFEMPSKWNIIDSFAASLEENDREEDDDEEEEEEEEEEEGEGKSRESLLLCCL
ncbi:hypothetical protein HZH66_004830 [Vespula vulgaris]|uniref:Uncharacterized protein n=1 Tax=Vespula vulgaris TaxID=7454 RepID=A0A834K9A0_VESVU|nr:hypothetical protein HZH66_004830 [Vespula vulgaris]